MDRIEEAGVPKAAGVGRVLGKGLKYGLLGGAAAGLGYASLSRPEQQLMKEKMRRRWKNVKRTVGEYMPKTSAYVADAFQGFRADCIRRFQSQ